MRPEYGDGRPCRVWHRLVARGCWGLLGVGLESGPSLPEYPHRTLLVPTLASTGQSSSSTPPLQSTAPPLRSPPYSTPLPQCPAHASPSPSPSTPPPLHPLHPRHLPSVHYQHQSPPHFCICCLPCNCTRRFLSSDWHCLRRALDITSSPSPPTIVTYPYHPTADFLSSLISHTNNLPYSTTLKSSSSVTSTPSYIIPSIPLHCITLSPVTLQLTPSYPPSRHRCSSKLDTYKAQHCPTSLHQTHTHLLESPHHDPQSHLDPTTASLLKRVAPRLVHSLAQAGTNNSIRLLLHLPPTLHNGSGNGLVPKLLPGLRQADRRQRLLLRRLPSRRVRESQLGIRGRLASLPPRSHLVADTTAVQHLLPALRLRLHPEEVVAAPKDPVSTYQLQACPDPVVVSILPLLHAELHVDLVLLLGTSPALRRGPPRTPRLRKLLRSVPLPTETVRTLDHDTYHATPLHHTLSQL